MAEAFFREVVGPVLGREVPGLRYAAGRLGTGSDVLGLDDGRSRDHDWGCRLTLLVDEADRAAVPVLDELLGRELPAEHCGLPVRFSTSWQPAVTHQVQVATVGDFACGRLGVDPRAGLSAVDWLSLTGQNLLEVTAGTIFVDETAELAPLRVRLNWYPPDVDLYVLASGWQRVARRMPWAGRTVQTGQPLQSRLLCAALVRDLMWLAFLLHRQWWPYPKWWQRRFERLPGAAELAGTLAGVVGADGWPEREVGLVGAVEALLAVQRGRGLPTPEQGVIRFYDRPTWTVTDGVADELRGAITDPAVARLPYPSGMIEQWLDSAGLLADTNHRVHVTTAYRAAMSAAPQ